MTTATPPGLFTEIDHVAFAVNDLEAAIAYYRDVYGATVDHREVVESDGVEEALLKVAESYIQLLTPTRPDSPVAKYLEKRGEGIHHIGYRVVDCGEALAAVKAGAGAPQWPSSTPRPRLARWWSWCRSSPRAAVGPPIWRISRPRTVLRSILGCN